MCELMYFDVAAGRRWVNTDDLVDGAGRDSRMSGGSQPTFFCPFF